MIVYLYLKYPFILHTGMNDDSSNSSFINNNYEKLSKDKSDSTVQKYNVYSKSEVGTYYFNN